jgi:hypothetical protein
MTRRLSRPFRIALAAVGLFAAVWFLTLRTHSPSSGGSSASAGTSAPPPAAGEEKTAAAPTPTYKGSVPGVDGLSRAIDKAHGAVAESQRSARALERESVQASGSSATGVASAISTITSRARIVPAAGGSVASTSHGAVSARAGSPAGASASGGAPASSGGVRVRQALVEGALKQGRIVVVLFWNSRGADDLAVHAELQQLDKGIAVFEASPSEVTSFGTITRTVRIYQTPTILIVNPRGQASTLSGLTDAYSIAQAIDTARSG